MVPDTPISRGHFVSDYRPCHDRIGTPRRQ